MSKPFWPHLPAILWAVVIMLLTGLPGNYFPQITSFWDWLSPDKLVHLLMFGILSFLMLWPYRYDQRKGKKRSLIVIILLTGVVFGGVTELLQAYVFVGRHGNIFDFFANAAGTMTGMILFSLFMQKNIKNKKAHTE